MTECPGYVQALVMRAEDGRVQREAEQDRSAHPVDRFARPVLPSPIGKGFT